jgi:pyruvate dehydrogenase E1 component alpha subunit/2-oxoisovalerate dehydrogenase E1 component alpha subunit
MNSKTATAPVVGDPVTGLLQLLTPDGSLAGDPPAIPRDDVRRMYRHMLRMRAMDQRMLSLQRQGRVGFYGTATGQEAAVTGSAYALAPTDWIFPALREIGASLWRGTTAKEVVCQLMGNSGDVLIGRQMPCHFSDRKVNSVAWSSVIGTQLVHAMGAAWAAKLQKKTDVMMGYMGDGASSSADFHAAANFAGVYRLPVVFFCQNNQWAISVPLSAQTASASIAVKAVAYGFPGVRVDNNDLLAVVQATSEAVARARRGDGPTLVEAVTFRMGGHSSSDDPSRYRDPTLVTTWEQRDPLHRLRVWLEREGALQPSETEVWSSEANEEFGAAIREAEAYPAPGIETMFTDVYRDVPPHIAEQMAYAVAMGEGTKFEGAFPI